MARRVGLALIGCGEIARHHVQTTREDPRLAWVAGCDPAPGRAAAFAEEHGLPFACESLDELLTRDEVEAVVVATPPTVRVEPATRAFAAGRHVLIEKPPAVDAGEVETVLAAQPDGRVGACCSSRFRATAAARAAAECVAAGRLGRIRRLSARVESPPPADYDGTRPFFLHRPGWGGQGVLADWGVYDLDYLLGLAGWRPQPKTVAASVRGVPRALREAHPPRNDVEVAVDALVTCADGTVIDYRRDVFAAGPPRAEWCIEGEEGRLELAMLPPEPRAVLHRHGAGGVTREVVSDATEPWTTILAGPVLDFVGAILDGRPPLTPLPEALRLQRLLDGIYAAARESATLASE